MNYSYHFYLVLTNEMYVYKIGGVIYAIVYDNNLFHFIYFDIKCVRKIWVCNQINMDS